MTNAILPMPPYEWQNTLWDEFCTRVENNKLPHAFLLVGQEGIGVGDLSVAMGQYLLCLSPLNRIACGRCRACQLLDAGTHPDLIRVCPEGAGKQIKVDQVREIAKFVDQTAQQGGYKIIVLEPAEAMNINAANALLKHLEEPPGRTIFFLVSHALNRVLPTIRSRCSKLSLSPPDHALAIDWLASVGVNDVEPLLFEAHGAPLLAKSWHDDGVFEERLSIIADLTAVASAALEPMAFAKKWSGHTPMAVLTPMQVSIEALLSRHMAERDLPAHYDALARALAHCSPSLLFRLRDRLCERKAQLLASPNLNAPLFIEELALDWSALVALASRA